MIKIEVNTNSSNYDVIIGDIVSSKITWESKILIITNEVVSKLYIQKILDLIQAKEVFVCEIKDGESYKNMQSVEEIIDFACEKKLDRDCLIIALGGGVISDISGFVAGIYKRGVSFVSIPTTLLAQVDASVGGKCGVNNTYGKNLIGLFNQPKSVYIDTSFLVSLPRREFLCGVSEIVKMAICFDREFFIWLKDADLFNNVNDLQYAIKKSVEIKAKVVSLDECESGIRAGLNYGHTFGHVIELLGGYSKYLHGEGVSIGMCMANKLAFKLGYLNHKELDEIRDLFVKLGLMISYKVEDINEFYDLLFLDKKVKNDSIRFVLPLGIGSMEVLSNVPVEVVKEVLMENYE